MILARATHRWPRTGGQGRVRTVLSVCRTDTTRVEFTIPLRENWALPFFAVQVAAITYFLRPNLRPVSEVSPLILPVFLTSSVIPAQKGWRAGAPGPVWSPWSLTSF